MNKKFFFTLFLIVSIFMISSCSEYRSLKKLAAEASGNSGTLCNCACYDYGGLNGKRRLVDCFQASDESACNLGCGLKEHKYRNNVCRDY